MTIGFSARTAPADRASAKVTSKTINMFMGLVLMARPPFHRHCGWGLKIANNYPSQSRSWHMETKASGKEDTGPLSDGIK